MTDPRVEWLTARLSWLEQLARQASGRDMSHTSEQDKWQWVDSDTDVPVRVDITDEYVDEQDEKVFIPSLRSVEEYPSHCGALPTFVINTAEEVLSAAAVLIVEGDPRSVLARVEADRVLTCSHAFNGVNWPSFNRASWPCVQFKAVLSAHRYAPGFDPKWLED